VIPSTSDQFERELNALLSTYWTDRPWFVSKLNNGLVGGGYGTGGQYLSHYQAALECLIGFGPDILYRLLQISRNPGISSEAARELTIDIFYSNGIDNKFDRLEQSGFIGFHEIGEKYHYIINSEGIDGYRRATSILWQYMIRMHRWCHTYFPWNLGSAFPQNVEKHFETMALNIVPAHPTGARVNEKIDFREYEFVPGKAPQRVGPKQQPTLAPPKWKSFVNHVSRLTDEAWTEVPWSIAKIDAGLINGFAGSGFQYFSDVVHLLIYLKLSGRHVIYPITHRGNNVSEVRFTEWKEITKIILKDTFNAFEFLADLGLAEFHWLGSNPDDDTTGLYWVALDDTTSWAELTEVNSALLTYINRFTCWVDSIYPWNLSLRFPQKTDKDVVDLYRLVQEFPTA
jgi:hypothetical protein